MAQKLYTTKETAAALGLSTVTIWWLCQKGDLHVHAKKHEGLRAAQYFLASEVNALVRKRSKLVLVKKPVAKKK
jgi:hypothetical protein